MKIIRYDLPAVTATTTTTTTALSNGDTTITVSDSSSFSAGDILLVEQHGNELSEIRIVNSVPTATSIVITAGISYSHISGVSITKLNYNQYKIERSSDNATFSTLVTNTLDYSNPYSKIEYVDESSGAADTLYYKISYVNSSTATTDVQATVQNQNNYGYVTLDELRTGFGVTTTQLPDDMAFDSINSGVEYIKDKVYNTYTLSSNGTDTIFPLDLNGLYIADWQADRIIDKNDIIAYEYDSVTELRTYVSHKLLKVIERDPKAIFSEQLPRDGKQLKFEIPITFKRFEDIRSVLKQVNRLIAANYVLANATNKALKDAVSSWSAGGVNVNRDISATQQLIENNETKAKKLIDEVLNKTYLHKTKLRTVASSLNYRPRGGSVSFTTQGGNQIQW